MAAWDPHASTSSLLAMMDHAARIPLAFIETWMLIVLVVIGVVLFGVFILVRLIKVAFIVAVIVVAVIVLRTVLAG